MNRPTEICTKTGGGGGVLVNRAFSLDLAVRGSINAKLCNWLTAVQQGGRRQRAATQDKSGINNEGMAKGKSFAYLKDT